MSPAIAALLIVTVLLAILLCVTVVASVRQRWPRTFSSASPRITAGFGNSTLAGGRHGHRTT